MSLSAEERKAVVTLELEKATKLFSQIPDLVKLGYWDTIANRLYYSAFHAVIALLIHDGYSVSTHKGAVAMLGLHYVKLGIVSEEDGALFSHLQTMREKSDYNCYYAAGEKEVSKLIAPAKEFIYNIDCLIKQKNDNDI